MAGRQPGRNWLTSPAAAAARRECRTSLAPAPCTSSSSWCHPSHAGSGTPSPWPAQSQTPAVRGCARGGQPAGTCTLNLLFSCAWTVPEEGGPAPDAAVCHSFSPACCCAGSGSIITLSIKRYGKWTKVGPGEGTAGSGSSGVEGQTLSSCGQPQSVLSAWRHLSTASFSWHRLCRSFWSACSAASHWPCASQASRRCRCCRGLRCPAADPPAPACFSSTWWAALITAGCQTALTPS